LEELMQFRSTNTDDGSSLTVLTNAVASIGSVRLHPGTLEIRKFVGPGRALVSWKEDHPAWASSKVTGNQDTWEDFAGELSELDMVLAEIRASLKEPAPDGGPPSGLWGNRRVNFVAMRSAAQWLVGAALCDIRHGHLEQGLQNLEAVAALARMNRDEYTLVAQMIRVAVTGLGLAASWEALQAQGWSEAQLERLQKAWEAIDLIDGVEKGFLGERAGGTELWVLIRSPNSQKRLSTLFGRPRSPSVSFQEILQRFADDYLGSPAYKLTSINDDEFLFMKSMQESIDSLRLARNHHSWHTARRGMDKALARIKQTSSPWDRFHYALSMMAIPNCSKAGDTAMRVETERQLTIAAIALKRFHFKRGGFPQNLETMVPEFLPAVPYDPMGGAPLFYSFQSGGDFLLYSVGIDGLDDGGDARSGTGKFGLWEGRDAVWPSPVTHGGER
jgi:hypothetical protein